MKAYHVILYYLFILKVLICQSDDDYLNKLKRKEKIRLAALVLIRSINSKYGIIHKKQQPQATLSQITEPSYVLKTPNFYLTTRTSIFYRNSLKQNILALKK